MPSRLPSQSHRFAPRVLLGLLAGSAAALLGATLMRNDFVAAAVGVILAAALAGLTRPGALALLGGLIGALTGLYLAVWAPGVAQLLSLTPTSSGLSPFWQVLVTGLVGVVYGYLAGVALMLYNQGRGPFL